MFCYRMGDVVRRLLPLALALLVAAAPVALELCEIHCTKPAAHSCGHQTIPDDAAATVTPVPHACAHAEELPANGAPLLQLAFVAPALLPAAVTGVESQNAPARIRDASPPRDPVPLALRTPLRV